MSNKLVKRSKAFEVVKKELKERVEKAGGLNISIDILDEYTKREVDPVTDEEFYKILEELSNEGCRLFKIERVEDCKNEKALMICMRDLTIAFVQDSGIIKKEYEEKKEIEDNVDGYAD